MSGVKQGLSTVLLPLAHLNRYIQKGTRLWAHAQLRACLPHSVDASVIVANCPEIHGTANIYLGNNLFLYRDLYWETQESGEITLGDDVVLSRGVHLVSYAQIQIGKGSMIGEYSSIRDANHVLGQGNATLRDAGHAAKPIHIGEQVWIGRGVTVLAGVTIGSGSVIGANAVVTQDVPAHSLAVGVPARWVKSYATS